MIHNFCKNEREKFGREDRARRLLLIRLTK